jgi:hypothetical protein
MGDEDCTWRAGAEQPCGLRLVEALIPRLIARSCRNLKSQAEERDSANDHAATMQNMDGVAVTAGIPQLVEIVMVTRDQNHGDGHRAKQVHRIAETNSPGRKIAGAHHDVGVPRGVHDLARRISVAMEVTEG